MQMKLLGAVMIIFGALCTGISYVESRKDLITKLGELASGLRLLGAEMENSVSPLQELLKKQAEQSRGAVKLFFGSAADSMDSLGEREFCEIWTECAEELISDRQVMRELTELGGVLGRYSLERQCEAIEHCAAALEAYADRTRLQLQQTGRLALGLPVSAGALMIILLM